MGTYTAEEQKAQCIKEMGEELGVYYQALWQQVAFLYAKLNEYVELYGDKQSRIDILNQVAPFLFKLVEDVLWDDILLHIARLTDPAETMGKTNLTIQGLSCLIPDEKLRAKVSQLTGAAIQKTAFCRDHRNRRLAHNDLNLITSVQAKPLEGVSRLKLKEGMGAIAEVLKAVSGHYFDSDILFEMSRGGKGAVSMLYILRDGLALAEERRARIQIGDFSGSERDLRDI